MSPHQELQYHERAHAKHMAELPPKLSMGEEVPVLAPTPATDEAERLHHSESVPAQFCREVERSRDELAHLLESHKIALEDFWKHIPRAKATLGGVGHLGKNWLQAALDDIDKWRAIAGMLAETVSSLSENLSAKGMDYYKIDKILATYNAATKP